MKRIGIIFKDEMVRAILDGRKTLTSRLRGLDEINEQPDEWRYDGLNIHGDHLFTDIAGLVSGHDPQECIHIVKCPFGQAGDVLVGRECWAKPEYSGNVLYRADYSSDLYEDEDCERRVRWKSALVMPWHHSRLNLMVLRSWPTRLQDMTEDMAKAEGVESLAEYVKLWDRINGKKHPWASNPWVWRVEFRREKNGISK